MWWNDSMISAAMRLLDYNFRDGVLDFKEWSGAFLTSFDLSAKRVWQPACAYGPCRTLWRLDV
jgi:hypothetical protein